MVTMVTAPAAWIAVVWKLFTTAWQPGARRSPPRLQAPGAAALFCLILVPSTALGIQGPLARSCLLQGTHKLFWVRLAWFKSQGYLLGISDLKQVNLVCCEFIELAVESLVKGAIQRV